MDDKKGTSYKGIFKFMKETLELYPTNIMTDFELSLKKALHDVWPKTAKRGCHFHFCMVIF